MCFVFNVFEYVFVVRCIDIIMIMIMATSSIQHNITLAAPSMY